jgi:hypothetical protein
VVFAVVGAAWIVLSDLVVETLVPERIRHVAQSVKGLAFIPSHPRSCSSSSAGTGSSGSWPDLA